MRGSSGGTGSVGPVRRSASGSPVDDRRAEPDSRFHHPGVCARRTPCVSLVAVALVAAFAAGFGTGCVKRTPRAPSPEMVRVEAGSFGLRGRAMDWPSQGPPPPAWNVTITRPFYIATAEVTQGLWTDVMGTNPSRFASCGRDCPVENVTWMEAVEFCNRLSQRDGLIPCYVLNGGVAAWNSCTGYRLPTEAEWEYAAMARGRPIGWPPEQGERPPDRAGCPADAASGTVPVDCATRNALGLYGMFTNVAEWCWDWSGPWPPTGSDTDPEGPAHGPRHVLRGAGWCLFRPDCLPAKELPPSADMRSYDLGFRVARLAP